MSPSSEPNFHGLTKPSSSNGISPEPSSSKFRRISTRRTVRGVALQATAGLKRGVPVRATGHPITVPVGDAVLGRLLDVIGNVRDNGPPLPADMARVADPPGRATA